MAVNIINGKKYIGVTGQPLKIRASQHGYAAKSNTNNGAFHRAIRKYGFEVFEFFVIKECGTCYEAFQEEIRLIDEFKPEYNSTKGGEGQMGRIMSEAGKKRISDAHKGNIYNLGKIRSEKTRARLREVSLSEEGKANWKIYSSFGPKASAKKVVCLNDWVIYESASAAARHYNVQKSSVIEVCGRNEFRKTVKGLVFRYLGDHFDDVNEVLDASKNRNRTGYNSKKKVIRLDDGEIYSSIKEAAKKCNVSCANLSMVCNGKRYSQVKGMKFAFYEGAA